MDLPKTAPTDRFGNPLDPIVGYARGVILKGTQEEVERMLRARHIVGERVRTKGKESVYDLSGMNRGSGITADDVPHLTSHVPFFERFEGSYQALWWIEVGTTPTINDALSRLWHLDRFGPTGHAFSFKKRFPPPGASDDPVDMKPEPYCVGWA